MKNPQLGNVLVKRFLEEQGVDLGRFKQHITKQTPRVRPRLNRMPGGEITIPVPKTNDRIKEHLKVK